VKLTPRQEGELVELLRHLERERDTVDRAIRAVQYERATERKRKVVMAVAERTLKRLEVAEIARLRRLAGGRLP
jgi:hypothetical protein